jgi:hypothetical protein
MVYATVARTPVMSRYVDMLIRLSSQVHPYIYITMPSAQHNSNPQCLASNSALSTGIHYYRRAWAIFARYHSSDIYSYRWNLLHELGYSIVH